MASDSSPEQQRLDEIHTTGKRWQRWGTYLSERQWGTVREDYSPDGRAWEYLPHDHARSRAYRWGEDGIGGFCDDRQLLCLSVALWNGEDPILKERLFGLTNAQGNHGEDVKELYYYLDATPTCSYARMLYKYPHRAYPYQRLIDENARRGRHDPEFELIDTGIFDDDRYFDVQIEYAKADVEDVLLRVTVENRASGAARLRVLPQAWFRNTWNWSAGAPRPSLRAADKSGGVVVSHPELGTYHLRFEKPHELLFCENETNVRRLFGEQNAPGFFKDAVDEYVVRGRSEAVNPGRRGSKVAGLYQLDLGAQGRAVVRVRLRDGATGGLSFDDFDAVMAARRDEAERFYAEVQAGVSDPEWRRVQRQALAGMLWNRQFYRYDVSRWLDGDPTQPPPPPARRHGRNRDWLHLDSGEVLTMPDNWEYPWFAAWDLAFHCVTTALIDPDFAKDQLVLLGREWYMHENGQLPAYEWSFGDVNPPVHAWAALKIYHLEQRRGGPGDRAFLERVFHKLMLNFTWWVNRRDAEGRNIFQGGFLGLDNIGVFDRSAPLPTGGVIDQSDGTAWMAMYCLNLMRIALELADGDHVYEDVATKFFEHFLYIAKAMTNMGGGGVGLWDDTDGFYYDVLCMPGGVTMPMRLRSMVGLIPLFAVEVLEGEHLQRWPGFRRRVEWLLSHRPGLAALVSRWAQPGHKERRLLSLARAFRMKKILSRMLDPDEFLSDYGVRALSHRYLERPYVLEWGGRRYQVTYAPGESDSAVFGGNSNWRGPVWMPVNYLLIESLRRFDDYYGPGFTVECPTGSGTMRSLGEVANELSRRLLRIFLPGPDGHRPVFGTSRKMREDPNFRDHILFYEHFHGDTGRGVGAAHQTGWTGLIANVIDELGARGGTP
jgi:hypothetical protein